MFPNEKKLLHCFFARKLVQADDDQSVTSGSEIEEEPNSGVQPSDRDLSLQEQSEKERESKLLQAVMKQSAELSGTSASKAKVSTHFRLNKPTTILLPLYHVIFRLN